MIRTVSLILILFLLAACGSSPTPTAEPINNQQAPTALPTLTPLPVQPTRTPITQFIPPTSAPPPTAQTDVVVDPSVNNTSGQPQLLDGGRGLTTGRPMNNGEFEVEGYCTQLNVNYGVDADLNNWYCTENGQRVYTLGTQEFDDICFRTYQVAGAYAQQIEGSQRPAYRWRCFGNQ